MTDEQWIKTISHRFARRLLQEEATRCKEHAPLLIPLEDAFVHTDDHPFCFDETCLCKHDCSLEAAQRCNELVWYLLRDGGLPEREAGRLLHGEQI